MEPNYYISSYETKLKTNYMGCYIIRSYLIERDDYGDCLKNVWEVIGETSDGQFIKLKDIADTLPTYSNSKEEIDNVIKKVIDR